MLFPREMQQKKNKYSSDEENKVTGSTAVFDISSKLYIVKTGRQTKLLASRNTMRTPEYYFAFLHNLRPRLDI